MNSSSGSHGIKKKKGKPEETRKEITAYGNISKIELLG
jgi:hypothetical protein